MEMKWNPIIDGDMSGIPRDEELLFTVFDEQDDETYVVKGFCTNGWPGSNQYKVLETTVRGCRYHKAKKVKAWMEIPEPFNQKRHIKCVLTDEERGEVIKAMEKAILIIDEVEF